MNSRKPCLIIDIDDTLYVHKSPLMEYHKIRPDYQLKHQLQRISYPKFVLTNAMYEHANIIVNKMGVEDEFKKIYARDNMPIMKPSMDCYLSVKNDIFKELGNTVSGYVFFDDLLDNLKGASQLGWRTIWISPKYKEANNYPFVIAAFPTLKDALNSIQF